eukprot:294104-Prorocentrum_minimum.AAC.4
MQVSSSSLKHEDRSYHARGSGPGCQRQSNTRDNHHYKTADFERVTRKVWKFRIPHLSGWGWLGKRQTVSPANPIPKDAIFEDPTLAFRWAALTCYPTTRAVLQIVSPGTDSRNAERHQAPADSLSGMATCVSCSVQSQYMSMPPNSAHHTQGTGLVRRENRPALPASDWSV